MRIYLREIPGTLKNELFFVFEPSIRFVPGEVLGFLNVREDGECIITQKAIREGQIPDVKPTMVLSEQHTREIINAFLDLAAERKIPNHNQSHAMGKLDATERHLADLRKLLKLK